MKNKSFVKILFIISIVILLSGCTDFFNQTSSKIEYEKQATKISYTITYGCNLNCNGNGKFRINYSCDTPEVLKGLITGINVLNSEYTDRTNVATFNDLKSWNISKTGECSDYQFGISANVMSEISYVNDLNGEDALSIDEIKNNYPDLVYQYCRAQSNKTTIFIAPDNQDISVRANLIYNSAKSNNSFITAKELFRWLKQNTDYETHSENNDVQPASLTINKKTGDCDDLTFLYLSLCKSLDIPSRFIRGYLISENSSVAHVWAEVFVGGNLGDGGWIPVECAGNTKNKDEIDSEIHQNFGVETVDHLRLFKDDGSNESISISLSGIYYMSDQNVNFGNPLFFADVSDYSVLKEENLVINENNYRTFS